MMIYINLHSVDYNQWLKRLDNQPNKPTNLNSIKIAKVVKPMNNKTLFKTLGTSVINSPMSLPSLKFTYSHNYWTWFLLKKDFNEWTNTIIKIV